MQSRVAVFLLVTALAVLSTTFLPVAEGSRLTSKLRRVRKDIRVPGKYFVHTFEHLTRTQTENFVKEFEKKTANDSTLEFTFHGVVDKAAHGFSCKMSKGALSMMLKEENVVEAIEEDRYIHAASRGRVVPTWGLDRLDQIKGKRDYKYAAPCNLTGNGTDVYVLDSGIWYSHDEFNGNAVYPGCDPIDQLTNSNRSGLDCTGHGSHVAGTIGGKKLGVAPGATIFSVRILDCHDLGTASSVLLGIDCVLNKYKQRKRSAVVNLSVYGEKDLTVKRAIDQLMKAGITVVSIAGNNNNNKPADSCKLAPGSIQGVITASASTMDDKSYKGSNAGVCVDLYAPGTNIPSATHLCDNCRSIRQGSSMAAPHVTGAVAMLLEKCPGISPWRVKHLLLSQMTLANKLDLSSVPNKYLATTPNLLLHTSSLQCDLQC